MKKLIVLLVVFIAFTITKIAFTITKIVRSIYMKKFIVLLVVFSLIFAAPVMAAQKATLISPRGAKVVVEAGTQAAQRLFGLGYTLMGQKQASLGLSFTNFALDVIGTKTGTTTAGVNFSVNAGSAGQSATSTYVTKIGNSTNKATYTVKALNASSTANARFELQGSNDMDCDTASSTTSISDIVLTGDVNWFSAGDHLKGKSQTTTFTNATSTNFFQWSNPMPGVGQEIILEDLNYECLRLSASGSSTVLWTQIKIK